MFSATEYANKNQSAKEYVCLHDDEKPTDGIVNGSICIEMDTGDVYFFNAAGSAWVKF